MILELSILVHFLEVYLGVFDCPLRGWLFPLSLLIHQSTDTYWTPVVFQALFSVLTTKLSDPLIFMGLPACVLLLWWNPPWGQQPESLPLRWKPLGKMPSGVMFQQFTRELTFAFVSFIRFGKKQQTVPFWNDSSLSSKFQSVFLIFLFSPY